MSVAMALAPCAHAQRNLSFEQVAEDGGASGWSVGGAGAAVDGAAAAAGERSLRVTRESAAGITRVTQRLAAADVRAGGGAQRLRFAGLVRADPRGASAALWLRVDGQRGPLFIDSYGFGREPVDAPAGPANAAAGSGWRRLEVELPLPDDVDDIAIGVSVRGQGTAWFDGLELEAVAADAAPPASAAAVRYLDAALAIMREHSLHRRDVDWATVRERALAYLRGAVTAADAHLAVRYAVRELGDRHSYLQSPGVTRVLRATAVSNARTGAAATQPRGTRLGRLAVIEVPGFAGGSPLEQVEFAESITNIVQAHDRQGVCGWIVDLRQNSGGNLWPMLAGLGPLAGEGELAASVYPDGRSVAVWHRGGQAGFGEYTQLRVRQPYRLRGPTTVAVLVGPGTASSGEVLALALRRPGTRSFGGPTRGLSAGNRTFALADGASLVLTVAATRDAAGQVVEGPLVPDEPVGRAGATPGTDPALDAAAAWLMRGDACR